VHHTRSREALFLSQFSVSLGSSSHSCKELSLTVGKLSLSFSLFYLSRLLFPFLFLVVQQGRNFLLPLVWVAGALFLLSLTPSLSSLSCVGVFGGEEERIEIRKRKVMEKDPLHCLTLFAFVIFGCTKRKNKKEQKGPLTFPHCRFL
jgi:hypothetical protein